MKLRIYFEFYCVNGGLQLIIVAVTNTNFLKDPIQAKAFYNEGAFVQTSKDSFKLFLGPFKSHASLESAQAEASSENEPILYNSNFWDFLKNDVQKNAYFTADYSFTTTREQFFQFAGKSRREPLNRPTSIDKIDWQAPTKIEFKQQYDWLQEQISNGKLVKGLPIALTQSTANIASHLPTILEKLTGAETANFSYGFWNSTSGMVGYTPEILSSWNKNNSELTTMALAGTWRKNLSNTVPNFSDEKNKNEHNYVIQDILNQLKSFLLKHQSDTTVVELPFLFHLKTNFTYFCDSIKKFVQAIQLLHPTAALGLFPRTLELAQEFSQFEIQKNRQQFGAPLGFISNTEGFMLVAIRNIMWSADHVRLFAGCGVTNQSSFEDEWQEILAKQDSVKKMLGVES